MQELRRIVSNRRLLLGLVLILLVNGFLFVREQRVNDYGLNLELPSTGGFVFLDGTFTTTQEPVDGWAAYQRYTSLLQLVHDLPMEDAISLLEEKRDAAKEKISGDTDTESDRLDYVAAQQLLHQTDYLTGYDDWLENIQKNKENLLTFSIFNDPNSFSGRNILKTADEFQKLQGVPLALGSDGAVQSFLTFRLTDYFLLVVLLLFGLSFLEERKAGLWSVVHASPRGRLRLAARRTAILFGVSVCGVLLLYGTDLALGFSIYGGAGDLNRTVQSVEALGKLPMETTVAGFLVRFFLLRMAAAFLVSLLLWLLLTAINNMKYTIIVAAGVLAAEYSLYTFLPVQSIFNVLKYFNLFTYISLSDLYTNYLNIDIFTWPLGIRSISQIALLPLCVAIAAVCITVHCKKKPAAGKDILGKAAYKINSVTDKALYRLHLFGIELYKTLWIQKGIVLAALLGYVVFGLSYTVTIPVISAADQAAKQYTVYFAGPITDSTFAQMDVEQASLDAAKKTFEQAQEDYANGLIEYPVLDKYSREASTADIKSEGLGKVRSRAEVLRDKGQAEGFTPWLIDETPFESVYGSRAQDNQQQAALVSVLALTLLLAGSMAYERQSGMTFLLNSTARGRGVLIRRKLLLAAVQTLFVWLTVYGMEVYQLLTAFDIPAWEAPAKNLSLLDAFPLNCSITVWLVLLYLWRYLALYCCGVLVLLISSKVKRTEIACIAACAVLLLPSLLSTYMGIEVFKPLSVILPVEAMPVLLEENGGVMGLIPWGIGLAAAAVLSALWLFASTSPKRLRRLPD